MTLGQFSNEVTGKNAIIDIGMRTSSPWGKGISTIGITYSTLNCEGQLFVCAMMLNSLDVGLESSTVKYLTIEFVRPLGITALCFLVAFSF